MIQDIYYLVVLSFIRILFGLTTLNILNNITENEWTLIRHIEYSNKYNRIIDTIKTLILHYYLEQILNHGMKHINITTINTDINEKN